MSARTAVVVTTFLLEYKNLVQLILSHDIGHNLRALHKRVSDFIPCQQHFREFDSLICIQFFDFYNIADFDAILFSACLKYSE